MGINKSVIVVVNKILYFKEVVVGMRNCVWIDVLFNIGYKFIKVVIEVSNIVCSWLV